MKQLKKLISTILAISMVFGLFVGSRMTANAAEMVKIEISYVYVDASGNNRIKIVNEYVPKGTIWKDFLASYVPCFESGKITNGHLANQWKEMYIQNWEVSIDDMKSSHYYDKEIKNFNQYEDAAYVTYYGYPSYYKHGNYSFEVFQGEERYDSGTGWDLLIPSAYTYGSEEAIAYAVTNIGIHKYIMDYINLPGATYTVKTPFGGIEGRWDTYLFSIKVSSLNGLAPTPTPVPQPTPNWQFGDVAENPGNWKYEAVKYVTEKGIMNGTAPNEFKPDDSLTRAMFATMLYRMAGQPAVTFTNKFPDVPANKWYSNAVIWASEKGIVSGYGDGRFGVNDSITREQIAKMLMEYGRVQGYNISQSADFSAFADAGSVSGWASGYMKWAVGSGMISGSQKHGKYYLNPKGNATRAESATMLKRFMEKY